MDQGISIEPMPRILRLALAFLGALFWLMLLGFAFGSSSASADDGAGSPDSVGSAVGGLVSSVTEPVDQALAVVTSAVAPVTHPVTTQVAHAPAVEPVSEALERIVPQAPVAALTAPLADAADAGVAKLFAETPLGDVIGPQPIASVLQPVAEFVDGTVAEVVDVIAPLPVAGATLEAAPVSAAPASALAATVATAQNLPGGVADGNLVLEPAATPLDQGAGAAPTGMTLFAAMAGAGFIALLVMRRTVLRDREAPGSPVFDTDSSPD